MTESLRAASYFPAPREQHFCSQCGHKLAHRVPEDDNRLRALCDNCGAIHYQNPRMVVGTLPIWQDQILLCRRAIEPRQGLWTLPAGFMELDETTGEGAARETQEEAGAQFELGPLFSVIDIPYVNQVHLFYLARLTSPEFDPGPESLEARLFDLNEIPWEELSFRSVTLAIQHYLEDRERGSFQMHHGTLTKPAFNYIPLSEVTPPSTAPAE